MSSGQYGRWLTAGQRRCNGAGRGRPAPDAFAAAADRPATTAQAALRWVIQQPGVTTVIPGARTPGQARQNATAASLPPLTKQSLSQIEDLYDKHFRAEIHSRW